VFIQIKEREAVIVTAAAKAQRPLITFSAGPTPNKYATPAASVDPVTVQVRPEAAVFTASGARVVSAMSDEHAARLVLM